MIGTKQTFNPSNGGAGEILFHWSVKIIQKVPLIVFEIIFQYRSYSVLLMGFASRFLQIKWFDVFCCIVIHGKMFLKPPQLTHCCLTVIGASCCQVFHLPPRVTYHHVTGIAGGIFRWVGVDFEGAASLHLAGNPIKADTPNVILNVARLSTPLHGDFSVGFPLAGGNGRFHHWTELGGYQSHRERFGTTLRVRSAHFI